MNRALLAGGAAAAVLLAAACSSGSNTPAGPGPLPTDEVTLTMWWWGNDERAALQQQAIDKFEEKYPFIKINGEPQAFDGYFDALATRFAGNDAPDVFTLGGAYPRSYGQDGRLLDLSDDSLSDEINLGAFSDAILASATVDDAVYGVPTGGNTIAVIANPVLFKQAGVELPDDDSWTWEEFADLATELSSKLPAGVYGAELRSYDIIGVYASQRVPLYDDEGNLSVTADVLEDLFQMEKDLVDSGGMPPADLVSELQEAQPAQSLFGQAKAAMFFAYSNQIGSYAEAAGNPADGTDDVVMLRLPGETQYSSPGTTLLPSQYFAANADTQYPRHAALFLDFLVNDPDAGKILGTNRGVPSSAAVLNAITPSLTGYNKVSAEYLSENLNNFGPSFNPPAWATEINDITQFVDSEVLHGRLTPAQAAQEWINRMKASQEDNS
jgi:multiple sugar transport system substrate-binding protein